MNDLTTYQGGAITAQREFSTNEIDLIKQTVCKDATDVELRFFLHVCRHTGLDPFSRQIYSIARWDNKKQANVRAIQTGIDGYRLIAQRSGQYAGSDDPVFKFEKPNDRYPHSASVTVKKIIQGVIVTTTKTAYWAEYYPGDDAKGLMWRKMPRGQLAKVAEALALRAAFPAELSGLYAQEEMERAEAESCKEHEMAQKAKQSINVDYESKKKTIDEIFRVASLATEGLEQDAKGDFMVEYMEVNSFKDLSKKTQVELEAILHNINVYLEKEKKNAKGD